PPFTFTPPPPISPLSLHDALPICLLLPFDLGQRGRRLPGVPPGRLELPVHVPPQRSEFVAHPGRLDHLRGQRRDRLEVLAGLGEDRKSTRLNSSHSQISYAVFCLK